MNNYEGTNYNRNRSIKEDAALIRSDVKALKAAGVIAADVKVSVRIDGGQAIHVVATIPRATYGADPASEDARHAETGKWVQSWMDRLTLEAQAVRLALKEVHDSYNHDNSDIMTDYFDVKFYGIVEIREAGLVCGGTVLEAREAVNA